MMFLKRFAVVLAMIYAVVIVTGLLIGLTYVAITWIGHVTQ